MKAETTPCPLLDFTWAVILPYQTYTVLASSVPEELDPSSDKVRMTASLVGACSGVPLDTQSDFDESPRYLVFAVMPSRSVNLCWRF